MPNQNQPKNNQIIPKQLNINPMNSNQSFADFLSPYDVIVWDWNGTLLDDSFHTHKVINQVLDEEGMSIISIEDYRQCFGFPISKYYASLGLPSTGQEFDRVAKKFMNIYRSYKQELKLYDDSIDLLNTVKDLNKTQYVLSAAKIDDLTQQINHFKIMNYFESISGASDIYAHGKIDQAKQMTLLFNERGYKKGLYIGDTDHDLEVSQELGFDFCFSEEGHQSAVNIDLTQVSYVLSNRNQKK